ncbi:hypothetical protein [Actinacidiphila oryziradicis]|uniref:Uncharacterized protein n=1 Tax=Actinacidiphila oryziradicis TaxID=2571141 RepID=A0A4U0S556_9ACTN|nr:hypothetical protein [Actinacidiphila oryziradicis]TKA03237.1 hypothetical protein FCI23_36390 [Actinacidiphila oryziradicis]
MWSTPRLICVAESFMHGSPAYRWAPVEVAAGPLMVVEAGAGEGTATVTVCATGTGEGELRSTSTFAGDRFGPQTRLWRLLVYVDP